MAWTINNGQLYFNTKLYTGTGATASITGVGFQPDLSWLKMRSAVEWNFFVDSVRGANKAVWSNATNAEYDYSGDPAQILTTFNTDGFSLGTSAAVNGSGQTFASWNWKAGGTASSNTDGNTATNVSVNQTAGFSVVSYTVSSETTMSLGHGLNAVPKMIITKSRSTVSNWDTYHSSLGNTGRILLDGTGAVSVSGNVWGSTTPTSSLFYQGGNGTWYDIGSTTVAYCFAEKQGFSKFGSYTGNGSTDGTFVYTGFKPAFCIIKRTDSAGYSWATYDSTRYPENKSTIPALWSNESSAEGSYSTIDFLSNGLKIRDTSATINTSGGSYIYMAFAEEPFVASNFNAATAR